MQFLKILFWCLLAFIAAIFTIGNWNTVSIHLWSGLIAEVNLPLLLLLTFLVGMIPTMIYYSTIRWRLRNRLTTTERALGDLRGAMNPPAPPLTAGRDPDRDLPAILPLAPAPAPSPAADPGPATLFPDAP